MVKVFVTGGIMSCLEIITAQHAGLSDEVTAVYIWGRRMASAVLLIEALAEGIVRSCRGKLQTGGE